MNRGTMGVNSLPKTVTASRLRFFLTHALLRMSPVWSDFLCITPVWYSTGEPTDSGLTENARLENRKLFKILFKLL